MRLGENPPVLTQTTVNGQIYGPQGPPSNGFSLANSLYYQQAFGVLRCRKTTIRHT